MQSQMWLCYQENIPFYDGYNTQGTLSQEKIINVMTCEKLAWRGNVKSIVGRVVRKYNVKFLSEGRSKSDCTFFVELWRSIVSEVCVSCAQEICTQSSECKVCVTVSDGRYKSLCTVWSWVTYNGECVSIALKSSVRKVLNVKFVSRGQFALAEKISRGRSTILNFQRHFLFVTQLISQQTNFWHRCDKTTRSFDLVSNDFNYSKE